MTFVIWHVRLTSADRPRRGAITVDLLGFRVSDAASAMRADRVFGVARGAALRECEPDVALALVAVGNGVVDWAVAFAAAARCKVAEAT
jgi:hypothetical protein